MNITRTNAAKIINNVRLMLADGCSAEDIQKMLGNCFAIKPLEKCSDDIHTSITAKFKRCTCSPFGYVKDDVKVT